MKHFVFDFLYFCIFELFSFVVQVETKYICCRCCVQVCKTENLNCTRFKTVTVESVNKVLFRCVCCPRRLSGTLPASRRLDLATHVFLYLPESVNASGPYLVVCKRRLFLLSGERTRITVGGVTARVSEGDPAALMHAGKQTETHHTHSLIREGGVNVGQQHDTFNHLNFIHNRVH